MNVLEARRRLLGAGVYKKTVTGNPAIAQGSLARMYPGIEMQGWTEQDSTTGAQLLNLTENTVTDSGITCVSEGSTITISGERVAGDGGRLIYVTSTFTLQPGTYRFSYEKFNDVNSSILVAILMKQADNKILGIAFTLAEETNLYIGVNIRQGKTADNAVIRCMLNAGSETLTWEPYTGGAPSPSPEYPQEITSAGNWNETAQKWEYEIEISNAEQNPTEIQTVTLQSDRPLTKWDKLEKRDGQWGWVYKSEEIESYTDESVPGEYYSTTGQLSVGAQVWYETTTETFVPLTASEQEAMEALHTYRPTTVLSNDAGCEMSLTYKTRKSMEVTT